GAGRAATACLLHRLLKDHGDVRLAVVVEVGDGHRGGREIGTRADDVRRPGRKGARSGAVVDGDRPAGGGAGADGRVVRGDQAIDRHDVELPIAVDICG